MENEADKKTLEDKSEINNFQNKTKRSRKEKGNVISLSKIVLLVIFVVALVFVALNFIREKRTATMVVQSVLTDEKIINELSTLIVPYGGIYESENNKEVIAYKGTATYGIDLSKIEITELSEKIVSVKIPKVSLIRVYINPESISSIPEGKINNLQERLKKCEEDLTNKFYDYNDDMSLLANESAKDTIYNFLKPIVNTLGDGYSIEVVDEL